MIRCQSHPQLTSEQSDIFLHSNNGITGFTDSSTSVILVNLPLTVKKMAEIWTEEREDMLADLWSFFRLLMNSPMILKSCC